MNTSKKKCGQNNGEFSESFTSSRLEFGRLYPNISETTTKKNRKDKDYGQEKTFGEFFSLAKRTF